jgi:hypothetical protein
MYILNCDDSATNATCVHRYMGMAVLDVNFSLVKPSEVPAKKEGPSLRLTVTSMHRSLGRRITKGEHSEKHSELAVEPVCRWSPPRNSTDRGRPVESWANSIQNVRLKSPEVFVANWLLIAMAWPISVALK